MDHCDIESIFLVRIGTERPTWTLTDDSNAIVLGAAPRMKSLAVGLDDADAARVSGLGDVVARVQSAMTLSGGRFDVFLVGKRISDRIWRGVASADPGFAPAESMIAAWDMRESGNVVRFPVPRAS